jgi:UDP-glucose 4-epimerase
MQKRVIVFGGSGFLGGYVVNELIKRNYHVTVADLKRSPHISPSVFVECDILDAERVNAVVSSNTDFIYNFAGFANLDRAIEFPVKTLQLNVIGNANILEAARKIRLERYVFASSSYALSDKGSFYGISKLASEKVIDEYFKRYGLKYSIIRYGSVYSELEFDNNYIFNLIRKAILTNKIEHDGDGEEVREYIHASDASVLSVNIIEDDKYENEHLILTGFERMKRSELFEMIKEILNTDLEIILKKNGYKHHYKLSPYSFHPLASKKLISNPFIDMGQGILECIKEVKRSLEKE